jgi:hypothetical protein
MPTLLVYFHTPSRKNKPINHLVAQYDPPYSHSDVQFADGMMSSVYQHCGVCWRKCEFTGSGFSVVRLEVSGDGYQRAYDMCRKRAENGYKFDFVGAYGFPLAKSSVAEYDSFGRTFCSKHTTEVLQLAGVAAVVGLVPAETTPSMLFRTLMPPPLTHTY